MCVHRTAGPDSRVVFERRSSVFIQVNLQQAGIVKRSGVKTNTHFRIPLELKKERGVNGDAPKTHVTSVYEDRVL